ncbi:MAG: hypothetical protein Mars2KO_02400 [Maribacter sp.]|uniref:hypothetical protein n=1 Tax=Maribacter sp. 2307UL18-2 TaxID=3386274 RepID=UPI0039BD3CD8
MKTYIEFKKKRELGDILSDTFAFLRNEFKPFFNTFLKIVGPYLLVMVICMALYMYFAGNSFNNLLLGAGSNNEAINFATLFVVGFLYIIAVLVVYVMSQSTTLHYIKSYANGKGQINFDEIKSDVYKKFGSFIGLGFLVGISVVVGFMLCFIPGIYLWVPLALSFSILVFSDKGATDAYGESFALVKDEWWITFATLLIIGIIVGVANYAFSIPAQVYQIAKMGIFSGEMDAETVVDIFKDPIYLLLNIISAVAQFLLNLISVVAGAFIYFNLNEKKNFTGTYEKIQNLGEIRDN